MEYKLIFQDNKYGDLSLSNKDEENHARITVMKPEVYYFPYLITKVTGKNILQEELPTKYEFLKVDSDAKAIRVAIKWLDAYKFKKISE